MTFGGFGAKVDLLEEKEVAAAENPRRVNGDEILVLISGPEVACPLGSKMVMTLPVVCGVSVVSVGRI